jgi:hypothetical protein
MQERKKFGELLRGAFSTSVISRTNDDPHQELERFASHPFRPNLPSRALRRAEYRWGPPCLVRTCENQATQGLH